MVNSIEKSMLPQVIEGYKFSAEEYTSLMKLIASFVRLDGNFSGQEEEFLAGFCTNNHISYENFLDDTKYILNSELTDSDLEKICNDQIINLINASFEKKEIIVYILFDISLSDNFLHLNEKKILQDISTFWGIKAIFGKGLLNWTDQQSKIISLPSDERIIVDAAPGSGKTAIACARITNLIDQGLKPEKVWLISFTRTATQELRDRISLFADNDINILGLKIATIDSRAWTVRFGFREDEVNKLFKGFDTNIREAIDIFDKNKDDFEQYFEDFEHVIIDEAQDITEPRSTFIKKLIEFMPANCGITIFGDKAQAIYGFTNDEGISMGSNLSENLMVEMEGADTYKMFNLDKIHRTNDNELIQFIDKFRMDVLIDEISLEPELLKKDLLEKQFNNVIDKESSDIMIIYRKRSEVLRAISYAFQDINIPNIRLRLSGLPVVVRPWIGDIFNQYTDKIITKDNFIKKFKNFFEDRKINYDSVYTAYERLKSVAGNDEELNIVKLKETIIRNTPPVELCVPDIGFKGPVYGTIHSSKGRQAENVVLNLSKYNKNTPEKSSEETKIIFVGASRAKSNLEVKDTENISFQKNTTSGRTYQLLKRASTSRKAQIEIGRSTDYDIYSIVSKKNFTDTESIKIQYMLNSLFDNYLDASAVRDDQNNYQYKISYKDKETNIIHDIGYFNKSLNDDLFNIRSDLFNSRGGGLPTKISYLKIIGVRTVSISENNPYFSIINPTFQKSKIWNVPIILGYPTLFFQNSYRRKY